jgi:hypothetical protein
MKMLPDNLHDLPSLSAGENRRRAAADINAVKNPVAEFGLAGGRLASQRYDEGVSLLGLIAC